MKKLITICLVYVVILCSLSKSSGAVEVYVPGTSNPWLAGMPDGTDAYSGDIAPTYSPVLVQGITLTSGDVIEFFNVTGTVNNGPEGPGFSADGSSDDIGAHSYGAQFSKSDIVAPANSLIGVFLNDDVPSGTAPSQLDFSTNSARDYEVLYPLLNQTFFIGDGLTSTSVQQKVFVPADATRLFLGTMDGFQWSNNWGSFTVNVIPEPATLLLLGFGSLVLRKRRA